MRDITRVAHHPAAIIGPPPAAAVHLPALALAGAGADRAPSLVALAAPARDRGHRRPHPPAAQITAEGLTVMRLVRDQGLRAWPRTAAGPRGAAGRQGGFRPLARVRWGTRDTPPDGQALALGRHHHFRALAHRGCPDRMAPAFAGPKRPSRKAWAHSSLLWASHWLSRAPARGG
jgi:hypothetical protein